jgi:hypothetical protein
MGEVVQMLAVVLFKSNKISQAQLMDYTELKTSISIVITPFKFMQI